MTFSIVARDKLTGQLGVATATAGPAVGSLVPHAQAGVAAIATQALTNPYLAFDFLARAAELGAEQALSAALDADPDRERRQAIGIDAQGHIAAWTGELCQDHAGHMVDDGLAVAGNILSGPDVLTAMVEAGKAEAPLAERLMGALEAGAAAGGDKRGINSAALKVFGAETYPIVDVRVDWSEDPLPALLSLLERTLSGGYADFFAQVHRRGAAG
ncbi:MAG: DUF1028 domain-containing protein [Devosia sp.]|uniref:DUF1028 domain-containing protein n=1 Tax=Devosia sp. TaxID=1871048 RepID=UPI0024CBB432|nr:DUF1028 domain-containing protein [Devosia sp.]UYN99799.1 MAG: DUF1028 domain-containing protein [Devosia sp.]